MGIIRSARQALRDCAPDWLNTDVKDLVLGGNRSQQTQTQFPLEPVSSIRSQPEVVGKPHWRRTTVVYDALDTYWADHGASTYDALIHYVQEETGVSCSRKLVSRWKQLRGFR